MCIRDSNISTAEADEQKGSELAFMLQTMGNTMPGEMSQMILADIAKLRKMPDLSKRIAEYKPQPNPLVEQKQQLDIALLQAQVQNESAKGQENMVDVQLKSAKTETELAKARQMQSGADLSDLDFVERESGVKEARDMDFEDAKHERAMEAKEHDRMSGLDKAAFDSLTKTPGGA